MTRCGTLVQFSVAILAVATMLVFPPRLRITHLTPKCRPIQQNSLDGPHRFVDDTEAGEEVTSCDARVMLRFEPVVLVLADRCVCRCSSSTIIAPSQARLICPLRRRPAGADAEDSLV